MYPIINLRNHRMDLPWYLRALEEVVIRVLSTTFSIKASRLEGFTGVWVGMLPNPVTYIGVYICIHGYIFIYLCTHIYLFISLSACMCV